ncbi:MAG TPA: ornithine cyclodeaminase family protein [Longimicrobiales bacterium]|nr:ornithine cyclodeaminase family protein [Longimicrobiales bacterium]
MAVQVPMIDADGVSAALSYVDCIELMEDALRTFDRGDAVQPMRSVIQLPDGTGTLYTMPAFIAAPRSLAVKMIAVFHGNDAHGLPSHQGIVVAFDPDTGSPVLLIDAARLTAIRTASVSAVATRALARADAGVLAVLGTGVQARSHIEAIALVRAIHEVRVWGRRPERARELAGLITGSAASAGDTPAVNVVVCDSAADAVADADIICTTTSAREPVLEGAWLKPGAHINAIGASTPDARELDSATIARSRVFVDSIDAALMEPGDLLVPLGQGVTDVRGWAPIGAVLNGNAPGRRATEEITLFKSVGLAIEDAAAAAHIARRQPAPGEA